VCRVWLLGPIRGGAVGVAAEIDHTHAERFE
jgi:hypothetical protein